MVVYSPETLEHFEHPRNVGSLDKDSPDVGTCVIGAPHCGDVMKLQILVDRASGKIADAKFKTYGCVGAIASSSWATEWIKGRPLEEAATIHHMQIAAALVLPAVKIDCPALAQNAVRSAIANYRRKQMKS